MPAGQRVGLLGPSGAGKSTLAGYLVRLADVDSGAVRLDHYDTRDVRRDELRQQVSILFQESVLFATTVRENIRYGRLTATDDEVIDAARRAGAHDFIMALPDGYDSVLGNRGDTLSGGQRQRLAIARSMVRDSAVVVLDEPTTGLDPASRALVEESLRELTRGRTTLAITHDISMIRSLDRLLWLEDGQIVEDGTPAELLTDPDTRISAWARTQEDAVHQKELLWMLLDAPTLTRLLHHRVEFTHLRIKPGRSTHVAWRNPDTGEVGWTLWTIDPDKYGKSLSRAGDLLTVHDATGPYLFSGPWYADRRLIPALRSLPVDPVELDILRYIPHRRVVARAGSGSCASTPSRSTPTPPGPGSTTGCPPSP
ncbi:ABC transporter ATP-binding protein [Corynebacterium suedekumii]|nr:ABC transporter ATP-binding protein [Corynebacterium suedekumii]